VQAQTSYRVASATPAALPFMVKSRDGRRNIFYGSTLVARVGNGTAPVDRVEPMLRIAPGEMKEGYETV